MLIAIVSIIWQGNALLGFVVASSLFLTLIIGTMSGTIIPIILHKLKVDLIDCFWTADYNVKRYFIFINLLWHCHCIHSLFINVKSPSQLRA